MWIVVLVLSMVSAMLSHYVFHISLLTFGSAAIALFFLSIYMGKATEHLAKHTSENIAGVVNVSLGNLAEIIIIFAAVRENLTSLVQGGIIGSVVGNLLLVLGLSIVFGCKKNGAMQLKASTVTLFIMQLMVVAVTMLLPTILNAQIEVARQQSFSDLLALMLVGVYLAYYYLSVHDRRFQPIHEQAHERDHAWPKRQSILVLVSTACGAFFMSEYLVQEVDQVAHTLQLSETLIGFIVLPMLGNIAEHSAAIMVARKNMSELSLGISVGSALQVGMIVAPFAVLFGHITGNIVTLDFTGFPFTLLIVSLIATYMVLRDNQWNIAEGVMLIAIYIEVVIAAWFMR